MITNVSRLNSNQCPIRGCNSIEKCKSNNVKLNIFTDDLVITPVCRNQSISCTQLDSVSILVHNNADISLNTTLR